MPKRRKIMRSSEIEDQILERLEAGETITRICQGDDMPTIRSFQRWCRDDAELDDVVLRSMTRGTLIQVHQIHDDQAETVAQLKDPNNFYDAKTAQALATIYRDQNHNKIAILTRLDKRFSEKSEVSVTGPMVIGWQDSNESCPNCGWNMGDKSQVIEHTSFPVSEIDSVDGEGRI